MAKQSKRLGRGLDSLITDYRATSTLPPAPSQLPETTSAKGVQPETSPQDKPPSQLPLSALDPNPLQPRDQAATANVARLAESIEQNGLIQPIVVRPHGKRYQIIAGERRYWAAKHLGLRAVPVVIREASDQQMLELALVENIQREDLNAIDRARAYRDYCDRFELTPEEVGRRLGEDRTTVVNYLRLLDLQPQIQQLVIQGVLGMGHARCLLGVAEEPERLRLAESVVNHQLSVRALEEIVRKAKTRRPAPEGGAEQRPTRAPSSHIGDLQRRLEEAVKTKVLVQEGRKRGTGRIILEYYSLDDFDRIAALLGLADA